jgi:hypothetical protein
MAWDDLSTAGAMSAQMTLTQRNAWIDAKYHALFVWGKSLGQPQSRQINIFQAYFFVGEVPQFALSFALALGSKGESP